MAYSRENFTVQNINRNTYICVVHWPGGRGPTEEFPDPLKANFTERDREIEKFSSVKRRRPRLKTAQNEEPQQKRLKLFDDSESFDSFSRQELDICSEMKGSYTENEKSSRVGSTENNPTGSASDVGTQTEISKYLLSAKVDTMLLRNEVALMKTNQKIKTEWVIYQKFSVVWKIFVAL